MPITLKYTVVNGANYRTVIKAAAVYIALMAMCHAATAQTFSADELVEKFDQYRKAGLQEKVYIHTDKNFYIAGEIIWMRLYNVDAAFNKPLHISKVAYTEILDSKNKPVLQAKLGINKGSATGSIFVPIDLPSGNYTLRAYTNWMKNEGADYFFEKNITIVNTQEVTEREKARPEEKYTVQFFPEGGQMVSGLKSKIAFIVSGNYGTSSPAKGLVKDAQNNTVAQFETLQNGMGSFNFTPVANQTYTADITLENGRHISQPLPVANKAGYVMGVATTPGGNINISVQTVAGNQPENLTVYLFAHTRNSIKAVDKKVIQHGVANFSIDENILGDGISHFTVFNNSRQPVCERLYFKYPKEKIAMAIQPDKAVYSTRDKITLNISANASAGKNDGTVMSLAVYSLDSLQRPETAGIADYLLLSSDLAGHVEKSEYYFSETSAAVKTAMDNLMLVHGWRRFKWQDILNHKKPYFAFAPEYNGHRVTGKIIDNNTGLPTPDMVGYLSVPGVRTQFLNAKSDSAGRIMFEAKDFYGTPGIIVQTNTSQDSNYHIEIDNPFYTAYSSKPLPVFTFPATNPATLYNLNMATQVQNVYAAKKLHRFTDSRTDSTTFYHYPSSQYLLDNYTRFTTFEEILREYVMQVNVRIRGGHFNLMLLNDGNQFHPFASAPLVLLDGVPIYDHDKMMAYDPLKTRKLEIVTRQYFYGKESYDGILNFVTYNGDLPGYGLDPHATVIDYEALQLEREFYSPVYNPEHPVDSHLPDFRSTLFWAPQVAIGHNGKALLTFYSGDLKGKYMVVAQALNNDGKMGTTNTFFEVK